MDFTLNAKNFQLAQKNSHLNNKSTVNAEKVSLSKKPSLNAEKSSLSKKSSLSTAKVPLSKKSLLNAEKSSLSKKSPLNAEKVSLNKKPPLAQEDVAEQTAEQVLAQKSSAEQTENFAEQIENFAEQIENPSSKTQNSVNQSEIIKVQNLTKSFDSLEVLKDISFTVHEGDVLGIIGPSGSGKSTLLRCICQLENLTNGSISICGQNMVKNGVYASKKELHKIALNVGLVFQNFNLFPHMSVLQNIMQAQRLVLKKSKEESENVAMELLKKMNLESKAHVYPCQLSGGQQQRVSIARALALKPQVLFFDEPTSALDPELTGEILAVIKELAREKMTMIVVTHEMSFARDISDHIIFMDGGVIVEQGNPQNVINNPQKERTKSFLKRFNQN